jgi:maltose-binding protein MalE
MAVKAISFLFVKKKVMKKIVLVIALLAAFNAQAQTNESLQEQAAQIKKQMDSNRKSLEVTVDRMRQSQDSLRNIQIQKEAERNGAMILQLQNERQSKQKNKMFLYLGMGVFFLAVLAFRLMRRKKKSI